MNAKIDPPKPAGSIPLTVKEVKLLKAEILKTPPPPLVDKVDPAPEKSWLPEVVEKQLLTEVTVVAPPLVLKLKVSLEI